MASRGTTASVCGCIAMGEGQFDSPALLRHLAARVLDLSWTHSQVALRRLDATDADVQHYERLASHVLYSNPSMRAPEGVVIRNQRSQRGLWGYGISGDLPIVLVRIGDIVTEAITARGA